MPSGLLDFILSWTSQYVLVILDWVNKIIWCGLKIEVLIVFFRIKHLGSYNLVGCLKQVADFGLSREEMVSKHASNIRGTFGYLDPEYVSTRAFTKKSDVYSFGVLLFELIAGRNPQQGLMEYVELVRSLSLSLTHTPMRACTHK